MNWIGLKWNQFHIDIRHNTLWMTMANEYPNAQYETIPFTACCLLMITQIPNYIIRSSFESKPENFNWFFSLSSQCSCLLFVLTLWFSSFKEMFNFEDELRLETKELNNCQIPSERSEPKNAPKTWKYVTIYFNSMKTTYNVRSAPYVYFMELQWVQISGFETQYQFVNCAMCDGRRSMMSIISWY